MIILTILSILLILLSGIAKAICDVSSTNGSNDKLSSLKQTYWRKSVSSVNKWKNGDPKQGERFLFSSTLLVSLTDAWHLFDVIRDFSFIFSGITLFFIFNISGISIWYILLLYPIKQVIFQIVYSWLREV